MASKNQRTWTGWILLAFSLIFMFGNGFFVAEYAIGMLAIPLVWFVLASNFIVWGLACSAMSQFKASVDDNIESSGKYQNIATMASIADHLADKEGEDEQIRHKLVMGLLHIGAGHVDTKQIEEDIK